MCVLFPLCLILGWNKQPHSFQRIDPPPVLGLPVSVRKGVIWSMVLNPVGHMLYRQNSYAKGLEKIYQCTLFSGLNSKDCLLPTVPQVIIKLIHLEVNKFSDMNRLFEKWYYLWNFLICRYVSYCMGMHTSSRVIDTLLNHTKQLSN